MSFLKETDYHGSRAYDGEPAAEALIDHFRLRVSLTLAWARLQIAKLMRPSVASTRTGTTSLVHRGEKHFTLLGARPRTLPAHRRITEIFPIAVSGSRKIPNDNL